MPIHRPLLPGIFLVLGALAASAQPPTDNLNGKTIHVYLPSIDWDTIWLVNGDHVMRKSGPFWHSITLSGKDIYQQDFFFRTREYRMKLTMAGLKETEGTRFKVADFQGKTEMWIIIDPSGPLTAPPTVLLEPPKTVNILNPWHTTAPRLVLAGGSKGMVTLPERCGWFMAFLLKPTDLKLHFQEINGTDTYGAGGFGSTVDYDLDPVFASKGLAGPLGVELWLDTDINTWFPAYPNKDGECQYLMAATVRDFSKEHLDFDFGGLTGDHIVAGMVQNGLSPARKPMRTTKTYAPNLFNNFDSWWVTDTTNPNPKLRSYETCTDIPMSKSSDGLWEYDSYRTPQRGFYPIDGFDLHADPRTPSCYNLPSQPSQWVTNQPSHNMNFCMESHAKFIYQKGQRFEFRGDDDVWVFIDGKLAIDLGGVHTPQTAAVDLDSRGLTPGKEYTWDFFYCERQPCGSSLKIKTSIFFRQQRALDTVMLSGAGLVRAKVIKREGGTGSCAGLGDSVRVVDAQNLTYQLWDAGGKVVSSFGPGGTFHGGGVIIATPNVTVDTAKIRDLPGGNYRIIAFEPTNEKLRVEIPFKINPRNLVEFLPNQDKVVPLGTLVRVVAANLEKGVLVAKADRYAPNIPAGLDVYQDSGRTQKAGPATVLATDATGYDTLWVTDTAMAAADKSYSLSIPATAQTVKVTFVVPKNKVEFEPPYAGTHPLGTLVPVVAANREGGALVPKTDKYIPAIPAGLEVFLDQGRTRRVTPGTQLATEPTGYDTLWVTGASTATADQTYVLSIPGSPKSVSLTFLLPRNRVEFDPPFAKDTLAGSVVRLTASNRENGTLVAKADNYTLVIPPGLDVYTDAARTNKVATGAVLTSAADGLDTLWATADSVGIDYADKTLVLEVAGSPKTVRLTFRMPPLDLPRAITAALYDQDGDGIPDRLAVTYDRDITLAPPKAAEYRWPSAASPSTAIPDPASKVSGTTLVYRGNLTAAPATGGEGIYLSTYWARKRDSVQAIGIIDRMGPILIAAEMVLGATQDTLRLTFSESVNTGAITGAPAALFGYKIIPDGSPLAFEPTAIAWDADRAGVLLVFPAGTDAAPRAGNLVRINDGAGLVADLHGNTAGPASRFRLISGAKRTEIQTVTYRQIAPPEALLRETAVAPSLQPMGSAIAEVVERTGRMGHLIKTDLGDYAVGDDFVPVQASQVVFEYHASYFTNHGIPVASDKRTLACNDAVFRGDCLKNRGFLFVGWNYTSGNGARIGTGAIVARIRYQVKVAGQVRENGGLDQVWGVLRED